MTKKDFCAILHRNKGLGEIHKREKDMILTFEELKEDIEKEYDVTLVCEALNITVEDLLVAFEDRLMLYQDKFIEDLETHET